MALPKIFEGDGRAVVQPVNVIPGSRPIALRRATIKRMLEQLEKDRTAMSGTGGTLWVYVTYALHNDVPWRLRAAAGDMRGWYEFTLE